MDAVVILVLSLVMLIRVTSHDETTVKVNSIDAVFAESDSVKDNARVTKTNDAFYKDENAFTSISRALGFPKERV